MNVAEFSAATSLMDACGKGHDAVPSSLHGFSKNPYPKEQGALYEAWIDGLLAEVRERIEWPDGRHGLVPHLNVAMGED